VCAGKKRDSDQEVGVEREWSCEQSFNRLLRIAGNKGTLPQVRKDSFVMCSLWHWSATCFNVVDNSIGGDRRWITGSHWA
jgi:hypothetical protein